jgi:hypothetical protein
MRHDMAKVITERGRRGSSYKKDRKGYKKRLQKEGLDYVKRESMKARGDSDKDFTDVLSPLEGFLRKNVGRPWGKVCSEISAVLPASGGISLMHARGHLFQDFVEQHTQYIDGEVYDSKGYPLNSGWRRRQFYVDPRGFLRQVDQVSYKWKKDGEPWYHKNNRGEWLVFDKWDTQCWFACVMVPYQIIRSEPREHKYSFSKTVFYFSVDIYPPVYDVMLKLSISGQDNVYSDRNLLHRTYGALVYCAARRQLGKGEIKKYKLNG